MFSEAPDVLMQCNSVSPKVPSTSLSAEPPSKEACYSVGYTLRIGQRPLSAYSHNNSAHILVLAERSAFLHFLDLVIKLSSEVSAVSAVHLSPCDNDSYVNVIFQYLNSTVLPKHKGITTETLVISQLCCFLLLAKRAYSMHCLSQSIANSLEFAIVPRHTAVLTS